MNRPRALLQGSRAARLRQGRAPVRSFGPPALAAMGLSALGSSILFILGVVYRHALGLTPIVFVLSAAFFVVTAMTYIEGDVVHPEPGGASTFARYAFDELWSFVAGWAILLDYLIVLAIALLAIPSYLRAFWGPLAHDPARILISLAAALLVGWLNFRGMSAGRFGRVLRIGLVFTVLALVIIAVGLATQFHLARVVDSVHLGTSPPWHDFIFAGVLAAVAAIGIDAASGLAPEIRVDRTDLRRLVVFCVVAALILLVGVSFVATMAVSGDPFRLSHRYVDAPLLGVVSSFNPAWLRDVLRWAVGLVGALVLLQAANGTMIGVSRVTYSLATNCQVPSLIGRLHPKRSTPYLAIAIATAVAFALSVSASIEFLAGIFAFGTMLVYTIAHLSVIALRFREPKAERVFRIPLSIPVKGASVPVPAALGALAAVAGWISVLVLHEGARYVGGVWLIGGLVLYVVYRTTQGKPLRERYTIAPRALQELPDADYGSILVPVFGGPLDDDIVATAGRLAAEEGEEGEGGAVIEALYVVEVPMSLPLDARIPDERIAKAKRVVARAKQVGEEYEGVVVATAMVRARSVGAAIVSEAKRRGVEAIVLAAEEPTRMRGGGRLGGRSGPRDRSVGETTRYVLEKAPCRVILTAPPIGEEGTREGVAP